MLSYTAYFLSLPLASLHISCTSLIHLPYRIQHAYSLYIKHVEPFVCIPSCFCMQSANFTPNICIILLYSSSHTLALAPYSCFHHFGYPTKLQLPATLPFTTQFYSDPSQSVPIPSLTYPLLGLSPWL